MACHQPPAAINNLPSAVNTPPEKVTGCCSERKRAVLLLLDEPFASIDGPWQLRVARCIADHVKSHRQTLLMVSHDMEQLNEMEVRTTEVDGTV